MRNGVPYKIDKLDNANVGEKIRLRRRALRRLMEIGSVPFVLDAYAGYGRIWAQCYRDFDGVAIEKVEEKCYALASMRPTWPVYCTDSPSAIKQGILSRFPINFVDCDTYGAPWEAIETFFASMGHQGQEWGVEPVFQPRLDIVATDGGGLAVRFSGAWQQPRFARFVQRYGAALFENYPQVCREMIEDLARPAGYELVDWIALRVGRDKSMLCFWAGLEC